MKTNITCTVCNKDLTTKYCGDCGQELGGKESTVLLLLGDLFSNFFSLQNSVPSAFIKILTSPNTIIDNYSNGFRNYYPSPGKMILFAFAVAAMHILFISPSLFGTTMSINENDQFSHVILLILAILFVTGTSYITYIRSKHKLAKHIISTLYLFSTFLVLFLILSDIELLLFGSNSDLYVLFLFLFIIIWNSIVFTREKKPLPIIGNIMIHLLLTLGAIIIFGIVALFFMQLSLSSSFE